MSLVLPPHTLPRKNCSNKKISSASSCVQRSPSYDHWPLLLVLRFPHLLLPLQSLRLLPLLALPLLLRTPASILSMLALFLALPGLSPPLLLPLSQGVKCLRGSLHALLLPLPQYKGPTPPPTPLPDQWPLVLALIILLLLLMPLAPRPRHPLRHTVLPLPMALQLCLSLWSLAGSRSRLPRKWWSGVPVRRKPMLDRGGFLLPMPGSWLKQRLALTTKNCTEVLWGRSVLVQEPDLFALIVPPDRFFSLFACKSCVLYLIVLHCLLPRVSPFCCPICHSFFEKILGLF